MTTPITVAYGDGIGPEIMSACLRILKAADAKLEYEKINIGKELYHQGYSSGLDDIAWESIHRTKVLLKAPITTPQGGGYKSLNVTLRKHLGLFANVRPCAAYAPFVRTHHPNMDVVIVRENEEDLYAGIEHRQTDDCIQCLKLITRRGCERVIRYAFDYAVQNGRQKVTCMSKDNIMKLTDGAFHEIFNEVAKEYHHIDTEHYIIDIGTARFATAPERFDVIVTLNLYGDIISDVAAELCGSVGLAGSANIGKEYAMFEAIHGSAPDISDQDIANPSGLLQAAIMMLVHIGQPAPAEAIHNAWLCTLESGHHTADIYDPIKSSEKLGTQAFADAVIANLGKKPQHFTQVSYKNAKPIEVAAKYVRSQPKAERKLVGVDLFVCYDGTAEEIGPKIEALSGDKLAFHIMTNRGLKLWPDPQPGANVTDHWRCRFYAEEMDQGIGHKHIVSLMQRAEAAGIDFIKTEQLYQFNDQRAYTLAQGE